MANFDEQIKKQGESFSLEPRKEVWQRVEAELDKTKRRRFASWIWVIPVSLLAGTGALYYSVNQNKTAKAILNTTTPVAATDKSGQQSQSSKPDVSASNNVTVDKAHTDTKNLSPGISNPVVKQRVYNNGINKKATRNKIIGSKKIPVKEVDFSEGKTNESSAEGNTVDLSANKKNTNITSEKIVSSGINPIAALHAEEVNKTEEKNNISVEKKGSAIVENSNNTSTAQKKQNASLAASTITQKPVEKITTGDTKTKNLNTSINWKVLLSLGISNNTEAYDFLKIKSGSGDSNLANTTPPGLFEPMEKSKPGLSLSLSVGRTQWLNKRWQWQANAGLQLQQVHQNTGIRYNDPITPSPDNFYSADYFFESGKKINHTGNNYRVFITNNIGFALLKKTPALLVNIGVTAGINVYDHYLLPDSNFVLYIRSDEYYRKFYTGINVGTEYTLKNGISVSATASHDFNKAFRPLDKNNFYWRSFLVNMGIPISKRK